MIISIITPVKNCEAYLKEAIESILAQTYPFIEHIIVDGGSTDRSIEIVDKYKLMHPNKIRFVTGPDRGACDALNKGWQVAQGDVLGWLGADDRLLPDALQTVADYLNDHPERSFVYGGCELINESGDFIGRFATRNFDLRSALDQGLYVPFTSTFYRRVVIDKTGPVNAGHKACDSDFVLRAAMHFKLYRVRSFLSQFRLHSKSISSTSGVHDYPKAMFRMNRAHGGGLFSPVNARYLISLINSTPVGKALYSRLTPWCFTFTNAAVPRNIAIFGASVTGYHCLQRALSVGHTVIAFIDNYPPTGNQYCNRPVFKPATFIKEEALSVDTVIIASSSSCFSMWCQLRRLGYRKTVRLYCDN